MKVREVLLRYKAGLESLDSAEKAILCDCEDCTYLEEDSDSFEDENDESISPEAVIKALESLPPAMRDEVRKKLK